MNLMREKVILRLVVKLPKGKLKNRLSEWLVNSTMEKMDTAIAEVRKSVDERNAQLKQWRLDQGYGGALDMPRDPSDEDLKDFVRKLAEGEPKQ